MLYCITLVKYDNDDSIDIFYTCGMFFLVVHLEGRYNQEQYTVVCSMFSYPNYS